ncbi:MAG: BMP family protein, partial [Alphaproteobacteria bacterium]
TPAAWNDPGRGAELAKSQFARGADVVFAAAGATGLGVMQAASDAGKLAIGVDSNQNHVHPGKVLTSMVKRVDVVVHDCMKSAKEGSWKAGHRVVGLKEDGVGYALDEHNRKLIGPEMEAKLEEAEKQIIAGSLAVKPYKP